MTHYARIDGGAVVEVGEFDSIEERFVPELIWVEAPETVAVGWTYSDGSFAEPSPEPPPPPRTDVNTYLLDAMALLGLAAGNALLAKYPTFPLALNAKNTELAASVIEMAVKAGDLPVDQATTLVGLFAAHGLASGADVQAEQATTEG